MTEYTEKALEWFFENKFVRTYQYELRDTELLLEFIEFMENHSLLELINCFELEEKEDFVDIIETIKKEADTALSKLWGVA